MSTRFREFVLPLVGILLLAINLRPAITAVGPIITEVGEDLSLSSSELGLLGALPIATFGAVSAFVQIFIQRFGVERVTVAAMLVLTGATVLRSWPGPDANLWIGTILIGAAIAVGNVAVPVFVKRSFPRQVATITGVYVAVLGICAGLAAAFAVPIAAASPLGWRLALGVWALLTVVALIHWSFKSASAPSSYGGSSPPLGERRVQIWRSRVAWQLSVYMGAQGSVFYICLTWLPAVEQHLGYPPAVTGWHMFGLQVTGVIGNLLAPQLMKVGPDERLATVIPGLASLISVLGFFWLPEAALVWVFIFGLGTGTSFVVSLSLIATRAETLTVAGQLSAMTQGVGYTITAALLFSSGIAYGKNPIGVLAIIGVAAIIVAAAGLAAGRSRTVSAPIGG